MLGLKGGMTGIGVLLCVEEILGLDWFSLQHTAVVVLRDHEYIAVVLGYLGAPL